MDFNFDIKPFEAQCFVSDKEWKMILESGAFIKTGKVFHTVFKKNVITFRITNVGNVELLNKRKIPCSKYKLPLLNNNVISFKKRVAMYLEKEQLRKGGALDDQHFLIYGT